MALQTGYNFVRAGAARQFQQDYQRRYQGVPETLSILGFIRMVQHRETPPHRFIMVTGLDRLWAACEDDSVLRAHLKQLLATRANWIRERFSAVYFIIPSEVMFVHGRTIQLRLPSGELVDLDVLFGGMPTQPDTDHYQRPFSPS